MTSFIKIGPLLTDDLFLGPSRRRGALHLVPHEPSNSMLSHRQVMDTDKEIRISLDVPGVKAADLSVTTDEKMIHISGIRRMLGAQGKTVKKSSFSKSFPVDVQTVDVTNLKANLADGVLVVTAPKKAKPAPRSILITTEPHELANKPQAKETGTEKPAPIEVDKSKEKDSNDGNNSGKVDCD